MNSSFMLLYGDNSLEAFPGECRKHSAQASVLLLLCIIDDMRVHSVQIKVQPGKTAERSASFVPLRYSQF